MSERVPVPESNGGRDPHSGKTGISVIVPVHDGGQDFVDCMSSLQKLEPAPEEVIVVADGDRDGSRTVAERFGARVLKRDDPGGPALARNLGAGIARGDILLFIDADVTVSPDAVKRVAEAFRRQPELAALFGSYDDDPGVKTFVSQYRNLLHHYVHQTGEEEASTFWGACGAIRREVFLEMGGYDDSYGEPSIEDIEMGYRLRHAGYRIRLLKGLQVKHLKGWKLASMLKTDFFNRALPWTRLILREGEMLNDLNLRTSQRYSVVLTFGLLLMLAAGLWEGIFLVPALAMGGCLLWINRDFYSFLARKKGFWFAFRAVPLHWLYYLYSGAAFGAGLVSHFLGRKKERSS
jgi:glycosyltransferase involved in cell wall biosynthesis